MNKEVIKLGFVYAGCFLGAGYVSGQELYQFFSSFGVYGFFGLAAALVFQLVLGYGVVCISSDSGIYEADKIIVKKENKVLRGFFGFFEGFFMFGIFVIMAAGAGTLLNRIAGIPADLSLLLFCLLCALAAMGGIGSMTKVFSMVVPALTVCTTVVFILAGAGKGIAFPGEAVTLGNPLLGNWLVSAGVFVSYNFFCSIAILAPVGVNVKSRRDAFCGIFLGCLMLLVISLGIILSMEVYPQSKTAQLPMLEVSFGINTVLGIVYGVLLLAAMFSTSLSCIVSTVVYLKTKITGLNKKMTVTLICALGLVLGRVGFSQLISFVYPLCGYLGFFAITGVLFNFLTGKEEEND